LSGAEPDVPRLTLFKSSFLNIIGVSIPKEKKPAVRDIEYPAVKIQNIVVSADLHATVDLYTLSKEVRAVDYEPEQFPGAIFRIAEPKAVIILFKNGKMICTGTNTEANIRRVLEYAAKILSKYVISLNPATKAVPKSVPKSK
jgi:transcription initiation factor TFIID TATA-box-binding protein